MRHWAWGKRGHLYFLLSCSPSVLSIPSTPPHLPSPAPSPHLGLVGLLQLQLVEPHLLVVLASQLLQGLCHPEVVLLLLAAVHLH